MGTSEPREPRQPGTQAWGRGARTASIARVLADPVAPILIVAGIVDVASGDPAMHGIALVAVAGILVRDGLSRRGRAATSGPRTSVRGRGFRISPALVIGGIVYALVVGAFGRFSWPLSIAVAVPGVLAVTLAWRSPVAEPGPGALEPVGKAAWLAFFLSLAAWEIEALLLQPSLSTPSWAHPTISTLMDPVLSGHLGRSLTLIVWLGVGGYLLGLLER